MAIEFNVNGYFDMSIFYLNTGMESREVSEEEAVLGPALAFAQCPRCVTLACFYFVCLAGMSSSLIQYVMCYLFLTSLSLTPALTVLSYGPLCSRSKREIHQTPAEKNGKHDK